MIYSRRALLLLPWTAVAPRLSAQNGSRITPTGLVADGATLNTRALQEAIDRCAKAGGGEVLIPPGRYLTGTLHLRDRVGLYLESGAVLLGSPRLEDYPQLKDAIPSFTSTYTHRCLIRADAASDVAIRGYGAIDGNGTAFEGEYEVRPYLLRFIGCKGVHMQGVTLRNSAMWVQHYLDCEDVLIEGIRVRSRRRHVNNDGIDIDSCRRVRISNCDIDCGDDAIVLKATTSLPCRDIVITNCILSTLCSAFKLGTESNGGFDNIVFSNSTIYDTNIAGIALEMVDGGTLSRINISNIVMRNVTCPLFLRLGNRARPVTAGDPRPGMGSFAGVMIRGIDATSESKVVSSITGIPGHPVEDVLLENIRLTVAGGGKVLAADYQVPEKPESYPEASMFGVLPAHGLYCRHVAGLSLHGVTIRAAKPDPRPSVIVDDADGLSIKGLHGSQLELRNVRHANIRESAVAVHLGGANTEDVAIAADQAKAPQVLAGPEVSSQSWRVSK